MLDHIKALEEFLKANHMHETLINLKAQVLAKFPQAPSNQLMSLAEEQQIKKAAGKTVEFSAKHSQKSMMNKKKSERMMQCLLGKIAYSSNLMQEEIPKRTMQQIQSNKLFQRIVKQSNQNFMHQDLNLQERNVCQLNCDEELMMQQNQRNIHHFDDELELIQAPDEDLQREDSQILRQNNIISRIDLDNSEISIVSQPSFVLEQLKRNQYISDGYTDDNDVGYHQYSFSERELLSGCSKLTLKYGYPEKAVQKNSKKRKQTKQIPKNKNKKFPDGVMFPNSNDKLYPLQYNGFIYDVLKMRVIFDREKTGCEDINSSEEDINIAQGDIIAGKYRIQSILGSGVFATVMKATDLIKNQLTCFKMISNNKDFFDQALDEIKLLRYINTNVDPDKFNILKYKGVFYHRQHLFIETDLLKDNLYHAYRKNPAFFSIPMLKEIARQIMVALTALHGLHVMHGDLKPENILIKSYHPIKIKVVDLGNSCFFHDHLGEYVQSRSYRAPEVVLGVTYDQKIDIWSVGCILAELWTKNVLFYNKHIQGMLARIQSIVGPWPQWMLDEGNQVQKYFSKQNFIFLEDGNKFHILIPKNTTLKARIRTQDDKFISFLQAALKIDPDLRFSAEQALLHPWLQ